MKTRLLLLTALCTLGFATPAALAPLPPLTGEARALAVAQLRQQAASLALWAEYYAQNQVDRAYWLGRSEQAASDAAHLETFAAPQP